jgi:hypothetical protein
VKTPLCLYVCVTLASLAHAQADKPRPRTYTNEDLERVHVQRAETGASSEVAEAPRPEAARERAHPPAGGEEYWRREAEREQRRMDPLRRRIEDLERRLAEKRSKPRGRRDAPDTSIAQIESQILALRARIRDAQNRFEDRARRAGALPGWLR